MGKMIEDEFTNLNVSRQRKWQLRKRKIGLCIVCGKKHGGVNACHTIWARNKKLIPLIDD